MLQSLNIPSGPLPDVPSAQHGASGDAGERAEFAQLLQQAKAIEPEGAPDAPAAPSAKDTRSDKPARPAPARNAHDHKPHDVRRARAEAKESAEIDAETADLTACVKPAPLTDEPVVVIDTVVKPQMPKPDDGATVTPALDTPLPARMHPCDPLPSVPAQAAVAAPADEHGAAARPSGRIGARDMRLPTRIDAAAAQGADGAGTHAQPAAEIALPNGKDVAFDLALRQAAGGRGMGAPLFDRTPLESTPAAAQAMAFARELHNPLGTRPESITEAALRAAPDDAAFAPALGAQVALWVKDGVQEARLQLHPAELGPVTVQIALDGQAAHIDFTAAVAATRESIEQSLPALAAALRESGFTLAGGGVFGRSGQGANDSGREHAPQGRARGTRGTAAIGGDGDAVAAPPRRWARSLVDVYA